MQAINNIDKAILQMCRWRGHSKKLHWHYLSDYWLQAWAKDSLCQKSSQQALGNTSDKTLLCNCLYTLSSNVMPLDWGQSDFKWTNGATSPLNKSSQYMMWGTLPRNVSMLDLPLHTSLPHSFPCRTPWCPFNPHLIQHFLKKSFTQDGT